MANGEILDALDVKINKALQNKRIADQTRTQLEIQQMFVIFLKEDHQNLKILMPQINVLWAEREQSNIERRDLKKMLLTPLISTLVTTGASLVITALLSYFWFFPYIEKLIVTK